MKSRPFAIVVVAAASALALAVAAQQQGQPPTQPQPGGPPNPAQLGDRLVEGLKATPGCLGVEPARTQSGRTVIFAWFENKAAAIAWYDSPTHQEVMKAFFPNRSAGREPMKDVPEDVPILVAASLKFAGQPLPGTNAPISEIAIELYTPLPGGIRVNGGFAPAALKVLGREDVTIDPNQPAPPGGR